MFVLFFHVKTNIKICVNIIHRNCSCAALSISSIVASCFKYTRDFETAPSKHSRGRMTWMPLELLRGSPGLISFRRHCCSLRQERDACYMKYIRYTYICMSLTRVRDGQLPQLMTNTWTHGRPAIYRADALYVYRRKSMTWHRLCRGKRMSPGVSRSCVSGDRVLELGRVEALADT